MSTTNGSLPPSPERIRNDQPPPLPLRSVFRIDDRVVLNVEELQKSLSPKGQRGFPIVGAVIGKVLETKRREWNPSETVVRVSWGDREDWHSAGLLLAVQHAGDLKVKVKIGVRRAWRGRFAVLTKSNLLITNRRRSSIAKIVSVAQIESVQPVDSSHTSKPHLLQLAHRTGVLELMPGDQANMNEWLRELQNIAVVESTAYHPGRLKRKIWSCCGAKHGSGSVGCRTIAASSRRLPDRPGPGRGLHTGSRRRTGVGGGELEWDDLFEFQPDQSGGQSGATAAAAGEVVYETVEERFNHAVQTGQPATVLGEHELYEAVVSSTDVYAVPRANSATLAVSDLPPIPASSSSAPYSSSTTNPSGGGAGNQGNGSGTPQVTSPNYTTAALETRESGRLVINYESRERGRSIGRVTPGSSARSMDTLSNVSSNVYAQRTPTRPGDPSNHPSNQTPGDRLRLSQHSSVTSRSSRRSRQSSSASRSGASSVGDSAFYDDEAGDSDGRGAADGQDDIPYDNWQTIGQQRAMVSSPRPGPGGLAPRSTNRLSRRQLASGISVSFAADDIYDVPAGEDTYGLSDTSNTNDGYQRPHPHHNTNAAYDTAGQPARAPSYRNLAVDPRAPPLPPRGRVQVYEVSSVLQTCTHAAHAHAHAQHSHGTDHLHIGGEAITFVKKFSLPETGLFATGAFERWEVHVEHLRPDPTLLVKAVVHISLVTCLANDAGEARRRALENEAAMLGQLDHPNVVTLIGACLSPENKLPYTVTEWAGSTLRDAFIDRIDELSMANRICMVADVCAGLAFIHQNGIQGLGLTAQCCVIVGDVAKIADLGGAKKTISGTINGTVSDERAETNSRTTAALRGADIKDVARLLWFAGTEPGRELPASVSLPQTRPLELPAVLYQFIGTVDNLGATARPSGTETHRALQQLARSTDSLGLEGYGVDIFQNSERELESLRCGVCQLVSTEPVVVGACGHSFCRYCIHQWLTVGGASSCPLCREPVDIRNMFPVLAVESLLCEEIVTCPFCPGYGTDGAGIAANPSSVTAQSQHSQPAGIAANPSSVGGGGPATDATQSGAAAAAAAEAEATVEATPGPHYPVDPAQHGHDHGGGDAVSAGTGAAVHRLVLDGGYAEHPSPAHGHSRGHPPANNDTGADAETDDIEALICPPPPLFSVADDGDDLGDDGVAVAADARAARCSCDGGYSCGAAGCRAGPSDAASHANRLLRSLHSDRTRRTDAGHAVVPVGGLAGAPVSAVPVAASLLAASPLGTGRQAGARTSSLRRRHEQQLGPQAPEGFPAGAACMPARIECDPTRGYDPTSASQSWTGAFENWVEHARTSHGIWVASPRRAGNIRFTTTVSDVSDDQVDQGIRFESTV